MPITDTQSIEFARVIRELCVRERASKARIDSLTTVWYGGMNARFPNDSSVVVDNDLPSYAQPITGQDVNSVMSILIAKNAAHNTEIIEKPCPRPIEAN